ncbi:unnamed protein product [Blepharisma stoltei]|uniref:Uncharacterized protein n=1 Tax=Blepharisma stoltei TaxID=1481888 RepID=A0AAU9JWJ8_9CILI|nr:unnamed protein product [Blepharisma stoltei]
MIKNLQIPIIKTPAYTFILWKHTLKRGISQLCVTRKIKIIATSTIQKNWRRFLKQKEYNLLKLSTSVIKDYWLHVRPERKNFKKAQFLSRFLYRYAKISYRKKTRSATIIQKWYKRFITMKKYQPAIQEKLRAKKHRDMMRKQQTLVQERNRKKQAARRIEQGWLDYMNKKRMRDIRKYLWSLPYECRLLYLKFKQVKQDADMLKADVEQMIANKQGSIASNVPATE